MLFVSASVCVPAELAWATGDSSKLTLPVDPDFKPREGKYYYTVDFNNVNIGNATIVIDRDGDFYKVQINAQSVGMVDSLYRLRYRGESIMGTDPLSPVETKMQQEVRSSEKDITIKFQENGDIKATEKKSENGATVKFDVRKVQTERFTLDPFSAMYLVRGLDWKAGVERVFDVYPGKYQYEIRLRCEGLVTIDSNGEKRKAWLIVPRVTNLDPQRRAEALKKKPTNTKIYVSADDMKDVLKIEASHLLGNFRLLMVRFDPAPAQVRNTGLTPREAETRGRGQDVPGKQESGPAGN